jgi:hypothetical protein
MSNEASWSRDPLRCQIEADVAFVLGDADGDAFRADKCRALLSTASPDSIPPPILAWYIRSMLEPPQSALALPRPVGQRSKTQGALLRSKSAAAALPAALDDRSTDRAAVRGSLGEMADNRALFIKAMSDPDRRRIAFGVVERNCRERFALGEEGLKLFLEVAAYVRAAKVDRAITEFEGRFIPMLDQEFLKRTLEESP